MNNYSFDGRLATDPILSQKGEKKFLHMTLIRNDYVGKDREPEKVAVDFTFFDNNAQRVADRYRKGDQMIVSQSRLKNNNQTDSQGNVTNWGYSFIVDEFTFGAPGKATRERLEREGRGHDSSYE